MNITVQNILSDHTVCSHINTPVPPSSGYEHIKAGPTLHKHSSRSVIK